MYTETTVVIIENTQQPTTSSTPSSRAGAELEHAPTAGSPAHEHAAGSPEQARTAGSPPCASGHLGSLTFEEHRKLIGLWGMLIEFLQQPYNQREGRRKDKQLATLLYQQSVDTAGSTSSLAESERSAASSGRSSAIQLNPLSHEFWCQASSGDLDVLLLRFLRARKWDLHAAFTMVTDTLEWRKMYGVRALVAAGEAGQKRELLESGKSFFFNVDKQGRLVVVITGRLHDKNAQTLEETCRYTVYLMELGRRLMQPPNETVTVIFDMADAPMCSLDLGSIQFMTQCFQSFYPESLGKCLIVNPPWIFSGFFRMVRPLLDPVVAAKIEMVAPGADMRAWIDDAALLRRFGGASPYEYALVGGDTSPTDPLSDAETLALTAELGDLQTRLVDTTIVLNSVLLNVETLSLPEDDATLLALVDMRAALKQEVSARYARLDAASLPRNMYHRTGVLSPAGTVNWGALV